LPATKVSATITAKASGFTRSVGVTVGNIFARIYGLSEVTGDTRTVQIGRSSAQGPIKQEGVSGLNKDIDEWVEADGTGHGHTRYSYDYNYKGPDGTSTFSNTKWNGQSFTVSRSVSWGSDPDYWWSPTGGVWGNPYDNDSADGSLQQMEKGTRYLDVDGSWQGDFASSTPHNVTYTVQDSDPKDGAKASAKYELMMHEEWEKLRPDPKSPAQNMTGGMIYLILPSGWKYTAKNPDPVNNMQAKWDFTISGTVSLGIKFSGTFDVFTAAKLGVEFNASGAVTSATTMGVSCDVPPSSQRSPFIEPTWRLKNYLVNHYTDGGGEILEQLLVEPGSKQLNVGWGPAESYTPDPEANS